MLCVKSNMGSCSSASLEIRKIRVILSGAKEAWKPNAAD